MSRRSGRRYISNFSQDGDDCRCGCAGKDPWHASNFRRVIRDDNGVDGWALFPWGASRVTKADGSAFWFLVDDADRDRVIDGELSAHPGAAKHNDAKARAKTPERIAAREAKRIAAREAKRLASARDCARWTFDRLCAVSDDPKHVPSTWSKVAAYCGADAAKWWQACAQAKRKLEEIANA